MSSKPSGRFKKRKQTGAVKISPRNTSHRISNSKRSTYHKPRRGNPSSKTGEIEKRLTNCIVVYTLFLLTASILWGLQVPKQVVFVLLVIPTLLIPPYLIPLRTRYTKIVYGCLILMVITILVAVLSFDYQSVLQVLSYLFPVVSK